MLEVLLDALKDSLIVAPFLFLVYALMEAIESSTKKEKIEKALSGNYAPFFAALTGIVPECGFSVMCAKLFDKGLIGIGTLIAAFIATSDEGLIVLMSSGTEYAGTAGLLILWKIIFAVLFGVIFNILFKKFSNLHSCPEKDDCIECGERHEKFADKFIIHPLYHTAKTFCYLLVVNFVLNTVIYLIGEDKIFAFMNANYYVQPLITAVVGIIPNCASSIFLSQAYVGGIIGFSGLLTGLAVNSGVGLLIILRNGKNIKKSLLIVALLLLSGITLGYLAML